MKENWQIFFFSIGLTMIIVTPISGIFYLQFHPEYLTSLIILEIAFIGLGIAICNFTLKIKSDEELRSSSECIEN